MVVVLLASEVLNLIQCIAFVQIGSLHSHCTTSSFYFQRPSNRLWKKIAACKVSLSTMKSLVSLSTE